MSGKKIDYWPSLKADEEKFAEDSRADEARRKIIYKDDCIRIRGANEHNLKHISLDIPRNELVVMTGLSGSGDRKSVV